MTWRRIFGAAGLCVSLLLICLWPSLFNGQPFFYPDTSAYIRGADAGFSRLAHHVTVWSDQDKSRESTGTEANGTVLARRKSVSSVADKAVLAGRSIYYGGLLYLGEITGRLWPAVLVQAAGVLVSVALTLETLGIFTWLRFFVVSLVLAVLTPMSFFTSFLMPDIFAAITILAAANLLALTRDASRWVAITWIALLSTALLFHDSHVLIALAMLIMAVPWALLSRGSKPWKGIGAIAVALFIAFVGEVFFSFGVTKLVGAPPIRPPFLMARMIADGPGYRYLMANCPRSELTICRFLNRLPPSSSDEFLWSTEPAKGVFAAVDPEARRKLADEQLRFVRATLAFDPVGELAAVLRNTWSQIWQLGFDEFNYGAGERDFLVTHIPEPYLGRMTTTRAWNDTIPTRALSAGAITVTLLAVVYLVVAIARRKRYMGGGRRALFVAAVVAGVISNALVCGALSRSLNRYQARVVWLLPLAALILRPEGTPDSEKAIPAREGRR
jgi:hypothetical protein